MKLLRPFTGTGAIFFPAGKPPQGTCEFATKECLYFCYATDPADLNFDEEVRIPESEKWKIYNFFTYTKAGHLKDIIVNELDGLQTPILHWFGSGDCPTKDVDKVSSVIDIIPGNIVQMGFTRNKKLWRRYKHIFALTVESKEDVAEDGVYSIPNYEEQTSVMYSPKYQIQGGYCGPLTCVDLERPELEHYINCKTCLRLKTGCFDR